MDLKVKLLAPNAILPEYHTARAAGLDLYSTENYLLDPGRSYAYHTGIAVELPPGTVGLVCPRSGLAFKYGVTLLNSPGVIDEDYRGEIHVLLLNHGEESLDIAVGQRIAQLLVVPVHYVYVTEVYELTPTERGSGGLGSTGR